ncbi:glycosyltransferase [Paragemmobacter aquarius]|uniref:glycosyltransferase n=1 Tax=Paragemmobacter aquarius TaxID=2169400 RepID=UPI00131F2447|nr:glycosyltransferase [Gemmobacter aquarius]
MPEGMGFPESWKACNPGWTYRFWTDDDLLEFFRQERPDLLDLFLSYDKPVQKADLARYCILHRYGGIYADIDTRCLASAEPIAGDRRVILCEEPPRHREPALQRGLKTMWFNGTMASPPEHPFWEDVIAACRLMAPRRAFDVLENTGPLLLSAVVERWQAKAPDAMALHSCGLFAENDVHGGGFDGTHYGPYGDLRLSSHLWAGSWFTIRHDRWIQRKVSRLHQARDWLFGGPRLDPAATLGALDCGFLDRPIAPTGPEAAVLVLVPVRDAEDDLPRCFELLSRIDHPKENLHVRLGHGDSRDGTARVLKELVARHAGDFASVAVVDLLRNAPQVSRALRSRRGIQRARRAGIARARNDLLTASLTDEIDWVLWVDADVIDYPQGVLGRLLSEREKIVTPDCVLEAGGPSFDQNAFFENGVPTRPVYYKQVRDGILQPPSDWWYRRHLSDLRYLDRVPLHGVGGTMLLVQADIHRAGVRFPERPYRHLIETEGFGRLARDAGVVPIGLPNVQIIHANR